MHLIVFGFGISLAGEAAIATRYDGHGTDICRHHQRAEETLQPVEGS